MTKKITLSILALLIILLSAYFWWRNSQAVPTPGAPNIVSNLFPVGENLGPETSSGPIMGTTTDLAGEAVTPPEDEAEKMLGVFRVISSNPVSGFTLAETASRDPLVRYFDRASGHIREHNLVSTESRDLTYTTLPGVQEVVWGRGLATDRLAVIIRTATLNNQSHLRLGRLVKPAPNSTSTEAVELIISDLDPRWENFAVSPDQSKIFFSLPTNQGSISLVSDWSFKIPKQLSASLVREWTATWPTASTIVITSRAGAGIPGTAYSVNSVSGSQRRLLGSENRLLTLPGPDAKKILYLTDLEGGLRLLEVEKGITKVLGLATLPEKCVWADTIILYCAVAENLAGSIVPDEWYQSVISYRDRLWRIDTQSGATTLIADPAQATPPFNIDVVSPALTAKKDWLVFVNKNDLSLLALSLNASSSSSSIGQ